ncbi:MAG TPA: hypothetical protein VLG37_05205 [Candidatus Saccharimonadales bacterium]|nr:hypothetical protein [Candidatus Saccharimonadales bacterium]
MDPNQQPPQVHNPLSVMQPGEKVICEIKRHPIGIIGMYITAGLILTTIAVLAMVVAPNVLTSFEQSQVMALGGLVFLVVAVITLIFLFISQIVYSGNRWILTSDSITQVNQRSLFDKQTGQLSLGNLEDVTAEQKGILARIFNYGVLRVETAGERAKFKFIFCPNPNYYAQCVLSAREVFEQGLRGEGEYGNRPPSVNVNTASSPTPQNQPPSY